MIYPSKICRSSCRGALWIYPRRLVLPVTVFLSGCIYQAERGLLVRSKRTISGRYHLESGGRNLMRLFFFESEYFKVATKILLFMRKLRIARKFLILDLAYFCTRFCSALAARSRCLRFMVYTGHSLGFSTRWHIAYIQFNYLFRSWASSNKAPRKTVYGNQGTTKT